MDDKINKTEPQEPKTSGEPAAQLARRPWVKPTFERMTLKEALYGSGAATIDGLAFYS